MNCHLIDRNNLYRVLCINFLRNTFHFTKLKTLKLHFDLRRNIFKNNKSTGRVGGLDSQFVIKIKAQERHHWILKILSHYTMNITLNIIVILQ